MKHGLVILAVLCGLNALATGYAADARQDFLRLVSRPRVPLSPREEAGPASHGCREVRFSFASEAGQRVPGILIEPADTPGRRPAVIVMHGTGGRKEDERSLLLRLAARGFVAVAIDGRYHGERAGSGQGSEAYQAAIVQAWQQAAGHPLFYDTVWDIMRLVDYLQSRADVDGGRIGLTGISKGGIETYLTAAVDPRIAAAVPFIGMQSFHWALANDAWQGRIGTIQDAFDTIAQSEGVTNAGTAFVRKFYDRIVPGIYAEFDGPQMASIIAPRPLLIVNSDGDNHCPLPGVEECVAAARKAYGAVQADSHLAVIIQKKSGHQVRPESEQAMIDWFVQWLKP